MPCIIALHNSTTCPALECDTPGVGRRVSPAFSLQGTRLIYGYRLCHAMRSRHACPPVPPCKNSLGPLAIRPASFRLSGKHFAWVRPSPSLGFWVIIYFLHTALWCHIFKEVEIAEGWYTCGYQNVSEYSRMFQAIGALLIRTGICLLMVVWSSSGKCFIWNNVKRKMPNMLQAS